MKCWLLHWMTHFFSIYWRSDIIYHCYFINIDFVNIYYSIAYMYQIVIITWSTNQVSKLAYISFLLLCLRQVYLSFWGYTLLLAVSRTICLVVTCEGGNLYLSYNPSPSQNPRSSGTSPLGLTSLNRNNHPIEVTLGGIGSSYASLPLYIVPLSLLQTVR